MDIKVVIEEALKPVLEKLNLLLKRSSQSGDDYQSPSINGLSAALSAAQGKFPRIRTNRTNPYFSARYADLDGIMQIIRPILQEHELSVVQQTRDLENGVVMLHTRVMHSSGEWIESRSRVIPERGDIQSYASCLWQTKRHAVMSLLNITIEGDQYDDDGELAMAPQRKQSTKGTDLSSYRPDEESYLRVTPEQLEEIEYQLSEDGYEDLAQEILREYQVHSLADIPKSQYRYTITRINKIKATRKKIARDTI